MKRILCFGDSLTWGFIPGSGERYDETKRWTKLLQKKLGNHYEIIENGISGRVSLMTLVEILISAVEQDLVLPYAKVHH